MLVLIIWFLLSLRQSVKLMKLFIPMQVIPDKAEAYRLLGEVKFELKDYEGSSSSYKSALDVSKSVCSNMSCALVL